MPCPFFMPTKRTLIAGLPHPERLPLGAAYSGLCTAAKVTPSAEMLHDCNLGYAQCEHLPSERTADALRFSVRRDPQGLVAIQYVGEAAHAPVTRGVLVFDPAALRWRERHADACVQRMAECCVESFGKEE